MHVIVYETGNLIDNEAEVKVLQVTHEEMVEILAAIRDTPKHGNEMFESAKLKAATVMKDMYVNDY